MCEHKLLAQIAILRAELTKREEQVKELQKENELLQAEQTGSARENEFKDKTSCISILSVTMKPETSNGDQFAASEDQSEGYMVCKGDWSE
eukprot:7722608-Ditylum_brightwellii.AAC.1